jgi:hypothetical protein
MHLTVRDLLMEGEPLSPAKVLAGEEGLDKPVAWVVSLRPYMPAFPRLRGDELALVALENLARLDLPPTLVDVLHQLAVLGASAVAVKGHVDDEAVATADELDLPLILLPLDAPMHDIEQAVMRECAMRQALAEVGPRTGSEWLSAMIAGVAEAEVPSNILKQFDLRAPHSIAHIPSPGERTSVGSGQATSGATAVTIELNLLSAEVPDGLALLLPTTLIGRFIFVTEKRHVACGIGTARPLSQASLSLDEARLAASASAYLRNGNPTLYSSLGADRLILLLDRDSPSELSDYVKSTLGPLLDHDARSGVQFGPTLTAFLQHGARLRDTASSLYIHRNTLAYRLQRIEAILGLDLSKPEQRLAIELALRAVPLVTRDR